VNVEQVHTGEQRSGAVDVHVRVVEPGRHESAARIDDARLRARKLANLRRRSDGHDAIAGDCHGFRRGPRRVHRVDNGVDNREVDTLALRQQRNERADDEDEEPQDLFHAPHANTPARMRTRAA